MARRRIEELQSSLEIAEDRCYSDCSILEMCGCGASLRLEWSTVRLYVERREKLDRQMWRKFLPLYRCPRACEDYKREVDCECFIPDRVSMLCGSFFLKLDFYFFHVFFFLE